MRISQIPARWRGQDEQSDAAWGDERQVAVWGQVSTRTLYLVVVLNVAAGFIFNQIDPTRYGPCVTVFFAIALGATAYAGWVAHRKGVDVRAPRWTGRTELAIRSLVFGVVFYAFERFIAGDQHTNSWPAALIAVACYAVGWAVVMRFLVTWQRRQTLRDEEAPDDTLDPPDPMV